MAKQTFTSGATLLASEMNALQTNDFNLTVSTKTAAYTFVVGDRGTRVVLNDTTARSFTINDSIFSAGDTINVHNINTGVLTIAAGAGVTLNGADVLTLQQYQSGTIFFTSASSAIFFPTAKTVSSQTIKADYIATSQSTTSTSYTDLSTVGPSVTITTGTSALVMIQTIGADAVANRQFMSFAVSGATTISASSTYEIAPVTASNTSPMSLEFVVTSLNAGSNTFTAKYKSSDGNSIAFAKRLIKVTTL